MRAIPIILMSLINTNVITRKNLNSLLHNFTSFLSISLFLYVVLFSLLLELQLV